jgi:cobalt-zinc-cadmium efflux system membrane fusion protein
MMQNAYFRAGLAVLAAVVFAACAFVLVSCSRKSASGDGAPPPAVVEQEMDPNNFTVDHADRFPLAKAAEYKAPATLEVTGVVNPDIARAVPVISLAAGRVVEIKARLGDNVKKGQVLLRVRSNDVSGAYQFYLKAQNDERFARQQYVRAQELYEKGAIAKTNLEQAEDTEKDAKVDLDTAIEQLKLMGLDKDHPTGTVDILAPISGVITDQQVTNAAGAQGLPGPNPFTISDLSYVWIMCDVYENDLDAVKLGQSADIHLNAYPGKVIKGRIDNIFPILDPNIRTAKVRIEVPNPEKLMRIGMFVTAMFYGRQPQMHASVPATAILHLHDRDWVYLPLGSGHFKRVEVVGGGMLPNNQQEVISGLQPGAEVIQNALVFQNTVEP